MQRGQRGQGVGGLAGGGGGGWKGGGEGGGVLMGPLIGGPQCPLSLFQKLSCRF